MWTVVFLPIIILSMFSFEKCNHEGCSSFRSACTPVCYHHANAEERKMIMDNLLKGLTTTDTVRNFNLVDGEIVGQKAHGAIKGSNFAFTTFRDCDFSGTKIINSFFDFCLFENCNFNDTIIRYAVYSGARFINTTFSGTTAIHTNFMGIDSYGTDFSHSDLYFSNFSMAKLLGTKFEDCNLKRTNFRACILRDVSFRYSNPEEAFFKEGEVFTI
jgi:hypothetical protein